MACTMTSRSEPDRSILWVGLAECVPVEGGALLFEGGNGAFANVVGLAASRESFHANVERELRELGASLVGLDDVEPLEVRTANWEIDDEVEIAAAGVQEDGDIALATLDIYMAGDE